MSQSQGAVKKPTPLTPATSLKPENLAAEVGKSETVRITRLYKSVSISLFNSQSLTKIVKYGYLTKSQRDELILELCYGFRV